MVINGEVKDEQTGGALVFGEDSDEEGSNDAGDASDAKQNDDEKDWNEVLENLWKLMENERCSSRSKRDQVISGLRL